MVSHKHFLASDLVECLTASVNCFVIDGAMTVFGGNIGDTVQETEMKVQLNMDDGIYDTGVDDRIVSISWRGSIQLEVDASTGSTRPPNENSAGGKKVPAYAWVLVVLGSMLMFLILCACPCPFGRRREEGSHTTPSTPSSRGADQYPEHHESLLINANEYDTFKMPPGVPDMPQIGSQRGTLDNPL